MTSEEGRETALPSSRRRFNLGGALVRFAVVALIDALLALALPALIAQRSWILVGLVALVALMVNGAYLYPRAQASRWLTPGLVFLLVFLVWPVVYSSYVSLTNYRTGNVQSKDQVIAQFERQSLQSSEGAVALSLEVYRDAGGNFAFLVTDPDGNVFFGVPRLRSEEPSTAPLETPDELGATDTDGDGIADQIGDFTRVPPLQRFGIADQLGNLILDIPGEGVAEVQTTSSARLVAGGSRYNYDPETDTLFDSQNNVTCTAERGNFVCGGNPIDPGWVTFIGFDNYLSIFANSEIRGPFLKVFTWNLVFASLSVLLTFGVGLALANAFQDDRLRGKAVYRSLLILPYAIPGFISIIIWRGLLNDQIGPVNEMINSIGISSIPWLLDPFWAKVSLLLVNTWLGFPYMFLICTGALQAVPAELKEAARVDGAGAARVFRTITLPLLLVSTAPLLIGTFAFNFNNFVLPYLLTNGGPPVPGASLPIGETDLLITFTFDVAISSGRGNQFALGSAFVIIIFLMVAVMAAFSFRYTRRLEEIYGSV
ncbi:MAG TPA: ABC transporter permease subunit [Acidimicrobiia bacterium]|nr:ABC transporter permease subunit [Acidimicrobiia bacterium]